MFLPPHCAHDVEYLPDSNEEDPETALHVPSKDTVFSGIKFWPCFDVPGDCNIHPAFDHPAVSSGHGPSVEEFLEHPAATLRRGSPTFFGAFDLLPGFQCLSPPRQSLSPRNKASAGSLSPPLIPIRSLGGSRIQYFERYQLLSQIGFPTPLPGTEIRSCPSSLTMAPQAAAMQPQAPTIPLATDPNLAELAKLMSADNDKAFENTSTSVAASQMRNALNNLADTVEDPAQKKVCLLVLRTIGV